MLIALSLLSAQAAYTLEGPSFEARGDANDFAKAAKDQDTKGRVVRRYRDGAGWEFVWRVEGIEAEQEARDLGLELSKTLEAPLFLFDEKGKRVAVIDADADADTPAAPAPPEPGVDWMEAMIEAHGPGRTVFSEADRVKLVFVRTLDDGRVAKHVYARRGTDLYLKIEAKEGAVVESETVALEQDAWLVKDGTATKQDLQRTRETIGRFGPTSLMPMVLDLEEFAAEHGDLQDLEARGTAKVEGETCNVYGSSNVLIAVGQDGLIRRVAVGGDERVMEYDDYKKIEDVRVPQKVRITVRGQGESRVEIKEIELNDDLDEDWFAPRN